jgi:hypothetical protein
MMEGEGGKRMDELMIKRRGKKKKKKRGKRRKTRNEIEKGRKLKKYI